MVALAGASLSLDLTAVISLTAGLTRKSPSASRAPGLMRNASPSACRVAGTTQGPPSPPVVTVASARWTPKAQGEMDGGAWYRDRLLVSCEDCENGIHQRQRPFLRCAQAKHKPHAMTMPIGMVTMLTGKAALSWAAGDCGGVASVPRGSTGALAGAASA